MFHIRLKKLREDKKLTQKELAQILNISSSTVGMYEINQRKPDNSMIIKIANYFNVTSDYLLGLSDTENINSYSNLLEEINSLDKDNIDKIIDYVKLIKVNEDLSKSKNLSEGKESSLYQKKG